MYACFDGLASHPGLSLLCSLGMKLLMVIKSFLPIACLILVAYGMLLCHAIIPLLLWPLYHCCCGGGRPLLATNILSIYMTCTAHMLTCTVPSTWDIAHDHGSCQPASSWPAAQCNKITTERYILLTYLAS